MKTRFPLTYLFLRLSLCNYMLYMHNVDNRSVSNRTLQHPGCNLYLSPCLRSQTQQLIIFLATAGLWQSSSTSEVTGFLSGQFVNSCFCSVYPVLFSFVPLRQAGTRWFCSAYCLFSAILTLEFIWEMYSASASRSCCGAVGMR